MSGLSVGSTPLSPEARRSPFRNSLSMCEIDSNCEEEIAYSQKKSSRKKKKRTSSESDKMVHHHDEEDLLEKSIELEEDNFIPEVNFHDQTLCICKIFDIFSIFKLWLDLGFLRG